MAATSKLLENNEAYASSFTEGARGRLTEVQLVRGGTQSAGGGV